MTHLFLTGNWLLIQHKLNNNSYTWEAVYTPCFFCVKLSSVKHGKHTPSALYAMPNLITMWRYHSDTVISLFLSLHVFNTIIEFSKFLCCQTSNQNVRISNLMSEHFDWTKLIILIINLIISNYFNYLVWHCKSTAYKYKPRFCHLEFQKCNT